MNLLDKPYVSTFLSNTLQKTNIPVVDTTVARELLPEEDFNFIGERDAIQQLKEDPQTMVYTNSESNTSNPSIQRLYWILESLSSRKF